MILDERTSRHDAVMAAARAMMTAARTAPKAKGLDLVEVALVEGEDLNRLSQEMHRLYNETGRPVFERDGNNILQGEGVIVIGIRRQTLGLDCGHCGYPTCNDKPEPATCAFNSTDVGIALGSAVSVGADLRIDSRVLYSAGIAAQSLGILPGCTQVFAIAIGAASKNPFFDRK